MAHKIHVNGKTKERLEKGSPFFMQTSDIYLKLERCVQVAETDVCLKDVATVYCLDDALLNQAENIVLYRFQMQGPHRKCISSLAVIQLLMELSGEVSVQSIGETDVLVEYTAKKKPSKTWERTKTAGVALVSFFGTALTIMAFHNDIGIEQLFSGIYEQVMGEASNGFTILEFSYSIGLALGITVFFNHFGNKRLTVDPTPIEVEMKMYENDINTTLIENEKRQKHSMEVRK